MATSLPLRRLLPEQMPTDASAGTPAQQAFRLAIREVEDLRAELQQLRASQAATRQAYWRQVGPVAAATVAARRALYEPLEAALSGGFLSRAEEQQVLDVLVHNAHSLQNRFGEDEAAILARYAPTPPPATPEPAPTPPTIVNDLPQHEQAAATARAQRQQRAQEAREAQAKAADLDGQALLQNTKTAYRQLARLHHPDRAAQADIATQQAQTELMQRITAAYAAGDLAALLSLLANEEVQLGTTPTPATPETEDLLRRYTQALAQQQVQLRQELATAQRPLDDAPWSGTEKQQKARLRQIKRDLRAETDYLAQVVRHIQEPTNLRLLLRELASQHQSGI
jgi:ketosteroid isomerase-like protein